MTRVLEHETSLLKITRQRKFLSIRPFIRAYRTWAKIREGLAEADAAVSQDARRTFHKQVLAFYMTKGSSW